MKRSTAAAAARVPRGAASESKWQEWISGPPAPEQAAVSYSQAAPVNGSVRPSYEDVAQLAYALWEGRGRPIGSPEEDWLRAEQRLRKDSTV